MKNWRDFLTGFFFGVAVAFSIAAVIEGERADYCKARVSSAHMSLCLDSKIDKAMGLLR